MRSFCAALVLALVCGCGDSSSPPDAGMPGQDLGPKVCLPADDNTKVAVVTDIDETLTTLDAEFFMQLTDPSYDPAERPDASTLMNELAGLGYRIIYLTARGTALPLSDGTTSTDATNGWLDGHQFPRTANDLYMYEGGGASGDAARDYKAGVIMRLQGEGYTFKYAYGNADTDILAYQAAGIPDDTIYLVGKLAGQMGVEPIPDDQAYTSFTASFIPTVPCAN